ncbi:Hydrolase 4 domain-containing protein [Citrus sinensis]|uniref:Hydrolase 4 domain-containing protein n=1 Tax=Citrus sinensis TaxID=2711 RepID=A0ACB8NQ76_CITSI|nr:Hydrolase 4 domain-containing protein [Citrus sinensis]
MTDVSVFHSLSYDRMYWAINLQRFSLIRRRHHRRFVISHHVRDPADSELSARFPAGPGVVIPNSHGEKLVGILHETGSKQLVIVCHGFQSTKDRIPMVNLAAALEREGISAFRFDFSGNGEAEDLRAIVQDFCAKGRVITAIIGHSKGGNAVLLYASKYNDISIVINISGRFNLKRGIEGRLGLGYLQRIKQNGFIDVRNKKGKLEYRVTQESLMDRLSTDIHAACHMICQDCRVLTIHGTKDKMVPAEDALEFDKFIPNHKLHIIEGADHEFTSHQDELASLVIQFIKANYQKDGPTSKRADGTIDSRM